MLNKIIKILLISLFLLLPLINSHLFDLLGIKWGFYVDGNYEFSKIMFFNILSGIILIIFIVNNYIKKNKITIPVIIFPIILVLILSTIFSSHFFTSLLGNTSKGHSFLMFMNLIGLYIILLNQKKDFFKKILLSTIISSIFVGVIGIKEYYFPTFDYGNLGNRALSTFGHPNYLALFILILIPFLIEGIKNNYYKIILFLLTILLFLTKSIWGILIFLCYITIPLSGILSPFWRKRLQIGIIIFGIITLSLVIYKFGLLTKLNSFISRFYIWETTINIIFSDIKNIVFGGGLGTLGLVFDGFKSPELYIFENIGFTADRSHNLFLNIFYNFGIFGLGIFVYLIGKLIQNYKNNSYYHSIVLFLIFTIFNFGSISHYLIIILIIGIISFNQYKNSHLIQKTYLKIITIFIIIISGIFGTIFSYNYYMNEYEKHLNINYVTKNLLIEKIELDLKNNKILSVNDYFYLGNLYWNLDEKEAIKYYNAGLKLLPDMWDKNSKYYDNYFVKKLFITERFYAEKFSNLKEILLITNMKNKE